jgi:eight-cysteine-cluster-containing protein
MTLGATACGPNIESGNHDTDDTESYTRERAAELSGLANNGDDICALEGWYDDGTCDPFCLQADGDCEQDDYEPCAGQACGATCTLCPPRDPNCVETEVVKQCQPDGTCSAAVPACGGTDDPDDYEPCDNKMCGDTCTLCPPDDSDCVETAVVKYCQGNGTCAANQPSCDSSDGSCQSDADCFRTGCSGQICSHQPEVSTCELRPEYACYERFGNCGCNQGTCSWADDADLNSCLDRHGG